MTWVKGQSGNPAGGKRGPRVHQARVMGMFWVDLHREWKQYGREVISHVRQSDPTTFLKIVASALPRSDIEHQVNHSHQIEVILKPPAWLTSDSKSQDESDQAIDITPLSNDDSDR